MREKLFENKIKEWLEDNGVYQAGAPKQRKKKKQIGWFIKFWGGGMSQVGIPDLLGCIRGQFFALEVKGKGGRPSELQLINVAELEKSGAYAKIVYPEDFEEIKTDLSVYINR